MGADASIGGWQERSRGYGGRLTAPATNLHLLVTTCWKQGLPGGRKWEEGYVRLPEDLYVFQNKKLKKIGRMTKETNHMEI